jgi:hypothetical protein
MERTLIRNITYKTPEGTFNLSKDNLAEAQKAFGSSKIGWKQCRVTDNGIAFFLDICEATGIIEEDYTVGVLDPTDPDSKNVYFSLCDGMEAKRLEDTASATPIDPDFAKFVNAPVISTDNVEAPIETPVVVTSAIVEPINAPVDNVTEVAEEAAIAVERTEEEEIVDSLIELAKLENTIGTAGTPVEETKEDAQQSTDAETTNNKEDEVMNDTTVFESMVEETAQEMKGDSTMSRESRINEATNEAGAKVKEAMGVINKYIHEFKHDANKIADMDDAMVYDYIMGRIDRHIDNLGLWVGERYNAVKDTLVKQRGKMKKSVKKAEDAVEAEGLDEETKQSVLKTIRKFIGQVLKSLFVIAKAVGRFSLRTAGIVLTWAYRIVRTTACETFNAGKAIGKAGVDAFKEIRDEFASDDDDANDTKEEEYYTGMAEEYDVIDVDAAITDAE